MLQVPLLIGGATTSKVHTAVKIAPHYKHPVVHVNDASRSVPVVSSLASADARESFMQQVSAEYERVRQQHAQARAQDKFISIADARSNAFKTEWDQVYFHQPATPGITAIRGSRLKLSIFRRTENTSVRLCKPIQTADKLTGVNSLGSSAAT